MDWPSAPPWWWNATEDTVKIDMNHPYAGKTLEYWVELVDLQ